MDEIKTYKKVERFRKFSYWYSVVIFAMLMISTLNLIGSWLGGDSEFILFTFMIITSFTFFLTYIHRIYGYGKKPLLLGIALSLWAVTMLTGIIGIIRSGVHAISIVIIISGVCYAFIAISVFRNKIKLLDKILAIIACFSPTVLLSLPFTLFILFCPLDHKRIKKGDKHTQIQEQELMMNDLNSQLQHLKIEFENGKMTQEEYEYKRKSLVDKL